MRVVILGAGQGKRLLPMTAEVPKALLDIGGRSLIGRQIDALAGCGLADFVVVTGYGSTAMEEALAAIAKENAVSVRTVYNPFYAVADNLASCWMARGEMTGDFIQINGDNLFRSDLVTALLSASEAPVTVAISRKARYDTDDMKVMLDGERLTEIGKTLPVEAVDAEAIGLYVFREEGVRLYREVLERDMRSAAALKQWFPSAVGQLAKLTTVNAFDVREAEWCEVDFATDLQAARHMVQGW